MSQKLKTIIEDLFPMNRCLLGEGFDNALLYINKLIPLKITSIPSGTQFGTWTIPDEWVVRDAWVKFKGKKIIDYKRQHLSLVVGSLPFSGKVTLEELEKHLHYSDEMPGHHPYEYKFYERDWGLTIPKNKVYKREGETITKILEEGEYEVFIDTEDRHGHLKYGVHTIPGKTDKEILLFAHLDHPFQANDNLSGVAALIDLVHTIKPEQYEHTIKLVFCAETIGSIAYAHTEDLSRVSFVIALDAVGNENPEGILLQKAYDKSARINSIAHLALRGQGAGYRQALFRSGIGSDEYVFNDPKFGVPGIMLTTHPYIQYHTSADTPEEVHHETIEKVQKAIIKTIEYYEKDFIPQRNFTGPLFRSKYKIQTKGKPLNLSWDYFIYGMDGKRKFSELCMDFGLNFELTLEKLQPLITDGTVSCLPIDSQG